MRPTSASVEHRALRRVLLIRQSGPGPALRTTPEAAPEAAPVTASGEGAPGLAQGTTSPDPAQQVTDRGRG